MRTGLVLLALAVPVDDVDDLSLEPQAASASAAASATPRAFAPYRRRARREMSTSPPPGFGTVPAQISTIRSARVKQFLTAPVPRQPGTRLFVKGRSTTRRDRRPPRRLAGPGRNSCSDAGSPLRRLPQVDGGRCRS